MRRLDVEPDGLGLLARHCDALAADLVASRAPQSTLPAFQATAGATLTLQTSILTVNSVMNSRLLCTATALMNSQAGFLQNEAASSDRLTATDTTPGM